MCSRASRTNRLGLPHTGVRTFENHSRKHSRIVGLGATDQSLGPGVRRISTAVFLLWQYVKNRRRATRVPHLPTLRDRARNVTASVTPDMLERTWQETGHRLDITACHHWVTCSSVLNYHLLHKFYNFLFYNTNCIHLAFAILFMLTESNVKDTKEKPCIINYLLRQKGEEKTEVKNHTFSRNPLRGYVDINLFYFKST
jgi:hypothetical protein